MINFSSVNNCWPFSQHLLAKNHHQIALQSLSWQNLTSYGLYVELFVKGLVNNCWVKGQHLLTNEKFITSAFFCTWSHLKILKSHESESHWVLKSIFWKLNPENAQIKHFALFLLLFLKLRFHSDFFIDQTSVGPIFASSPSKAIIQSAFCIQIGHTFWIYYYLRASMHACARKGPSS